MSPRAAIAWSLRLAVGGVFVYAGATKLGDPHAFATQIEGFRIVDGLPAELAAVYLPWLETAAGLGS